MANLPNALDRRDYLYSKPKRKPDFEALGTEYESVGNLSDSVECYERIEDESTRHRKLKGVRATAIKTGIFFLLNTIDNTLPLSKDEWIETARKAKELGKLQYFYKAAQRSEDEALIDEAREALGLPKPGEEEGFVDYLQSAEGEVPAGDAPAGDAPAGDAPAEDEAAEDAAAG